MNENSTDQDSVESCSDRLVLSNDFIDLDSIGNPLVDGLVDQPQQEKWAGGLNLAVESEILDSEFGTEDPIVNSGAIGKEGGFDTIPKGRSIAHNMVYNQCAVFLSFDIETAGEIAGIVQIYSEIVRLKINSAKKKVDLDHADDIL
jgi:hypothetical protein